MYRILKYGLFIFLPVVIFSCAREEDVTDPVINFIEPGNGLVVDMPDTLDVKVEINDDQVIQTASLTLVNDDKTPVIPGRFYYPNSKSFLIETSFILEDKTLPTGTYQLQVTAFDGANTKFKYLEIKLNEIPAIIMAYVAVTAPVSFNSNITRLNPAFETDTQFVIQQAHNLSGVQGLWGKFFFISDEPSVLTAYHAASFDMEWDVVSTPPRTLITAVFLDKDLIFSTANGDVGVLIEDGTLVLRTAPFQDKMIQCLAADEKYIYAAHVSLNGDIHELTVYYRVTGAIMEQELVSGEIRSLVPAREKLLLFMPSVSGTGILEYDPEEMIPTEMSFLPGENLRSAVKISDNELFLLTDRCVITYELENNRFTDFTSQPYDFCRYDQLSDIIYLARENMVYGFYRISGNLSEEISFPDKVLDFQILYNK